MNCRLCKKENVSLTDVRGQDELDTKFRMLLALKNEEVSESAPFHCCMDCLIQLHRLEPEPLRESTPHSLSIPNSPMITDESASSSESLVNSVITQSELPVVPSQPNQIESNANSEDNLMGPPPSDPNLRAQYENIIKLAAPMSVKRRKLRELNINDPRNSNQDSLEDAFMRKATQQKRARLESRRERRSQRRNDSSSLSSSSSLIDRSVFTDTVTAATPSRREAISPASSQLTILSPTELLSQDRRRYPSSSLSSSEDLLTRSLRENLRNDPKVPSRPGPVRAVQQPRATSPPPVSSPESSTSLPPPPRRPVPGPSSKTAPGPFSKPGPGPSSKTAPGRPRKSTTPPSPRRAPPGPSSRAPPAQPIRPTPASPSRSRTDDGNAHSNSAAPRRINPVPSPPVRDPRPISRKYVSGG